VAEYHKGEAREWAREQMRGVANTITPTFTQDLRNVNERAARFDVRKEIEFGFWGALLVSETATTLDEYLCLMEWAVDEAKGRLRLIHHASFNTLEENIRAVEAVERVGAELVLLSYPPTFYPRSQDDIYEYTRTFCTHTNLGVILFPVPLWGFERLHPAGMEPQLVKRMVETIPNIVCIKAESGMPTIAGFVQAYKMFSHQVLISLPLEHDALPLSGLVPIPFMGTSNYEYFGPMIPRIHALMQKGDFNGAMELYWQIHPARMANLAGFGSISGSNLIHRMMWKYQGWLSGFNGGPLRQPTMRIAPQQMAAFRQALARSGLDVAKEPDADFFVGRNPE